MNVLKTQPEIVIIPALGKDKGANKDLASVVITDRAMECALNKNLILPPQRTFVSGCLKDFLPQWKMISEDPVTLDAVTGITIPFEELPPRRVPSQQELMSQDEDPVVDESIRELLDLKAAVIVPRDSPGFFSSVFTVPKLERGVEYARRFIIILKVS